MNWPTELNGIPLSWRTQWLLFAPAWMLVHPLKFDIEETP